MNRCMNNSSPERKRCVPPMGGRGSCRVGSTSPQDQHHQGQSRSAWATIAIVVAAGLGVSGAWLAPSSFAAQPSSANLPEGMTPRTYSAIESGLAYLARTQSRDGSWGNRGRYGAYPVAMTSLAGLALLMDGNTTTQGRYAPQVDRATRYLLRSATKTGLIARPGQASRPMYGHGFAMLFLGQLYGMTEDVSRARQIHDVLVKAVDLTSRGQSPLGGWYYTPGSRNDEGSVTVTQVQALRSCRNAGIAVPIAVINSAMDYLAKSQNSDGGIRYALRQRRGNSRPAITAAAVCCWYNAGQYASPLAKKALEYCLPRIKPQSTEGGHDFYAHFYFAQALYISNSAHWDKYFAQRQEFLLGLQRPDGSWNGDSVGDIYGTSLALVILQLPYNQLPIMQQ